MKIAVFLPNWVGDAVMATPAIRALRRHFRGARIVGVLKPYIAGVFEGCPWIDDLVFLDGKGPAEHGWPAAASRLRHERIELAVLFQNTFRSALVAPEIAAKFKSLEFTPAGQCGADFGAHLRQQHERIARIVKAAGMRID